MALLSSPLGAMAARYDVIVVGSGYGGAVAASRLARASKPDGSSVRVCLLERGREIPVGRFPDSLGEAGREFQVDMPQGRMGREDALYDLRVNEDISVFQGCGLGGTSLVNANVALRPERRVWADPGWPQGLREDLDEGLEAGFRRAEAMLRPSAYPDDAPRLAKYQALARSGEALGTDGATYRPPINVCFTDGVNHVGVEQRRCTGCGDCVSGCNVGAKNTLMMNYIPDARNRGAEIFCGAVVRRVDAADGRWRVYYRPAGCDRELFDAPDLFVDADVVVLGAGCLGTNEILLRSKAAGLICSNRLGERFTGNGDVLGFGYNNDIPVNGIGIGTKTRAAVAPPGPCITGIVDRREQAELDNGFVLEEGTLPSAMHAVLPGAFKVAAAATGEDTDRGMWDRIREKAREWTSLLRGAYHGAVHRTQVYLLMAHDDAGGRLSLSRDRLRVAWEGVGQQPIIRQLNEVMGQATRATGGTFVPSPLFNRVFGYDLVTVHPLGGCGLADDAAGGVADHCGRVFAATTGDQVHPGLYVCDGAMMSRPLGVNPLLSISALAERNMALLAADHDWDIDYAVSSRPARYDGTPDAVPTTALQFTERMAGYVSTDRLDDYEAAATVGREHDSTCAFVLTIQTPDLDRFIADAAHEACLVGTVEIPVLSASPMTARAGRFNLFVEDPGQAGTKRMLYRMALSSVEGRDYHFEGYKLIRDESGLDLWDDTTTLYVLVRDGVSSDGAVVAMGVLRIEAPDFARQMATMKAYGPDGALSPGAVARFGQFFAGELWGTYGAEALAARSE